MTSFQDVTDFGAKDFSYDHRSGIDVLYVPVMTISSVFISKWAQERKPEQACLESLLDERQNKEGLVFKLAPSGFGTTISFATSAAS